MLKFNSVKYLIIVGILMVYGGLSMKLEFFGYWARMRE